MSILFRMNPLSLVLIAMVVLERFDQAEEALSFIEKVGRFLNFLYLHRF
jgi:hypothetical protein